jgi:hypothetical protein
VPGAGAAKAGVDCRSGLLERVWVVMQEICHVGHEEVGVELVRELRGVLGDVEVAVFLRSSGEFLERRQPAAQKRGNLFFDRARVGIELGGGGHEEAAAREDTPFEVAEERFAQSLQAGQG